METFSDCAFPTHQRLWISTKGETRLKYRVAILPYDSLTSRKIKQKRRKKKKSDEHDHCKQKPFTSSPCWVMILSQLELSANTSSKRFFFLPRKGHVQVLFSCLSLICKHQTKKSDNSRNQVRLVQLAEVFGADEKSSEVGSMTSFRGVDHVVVCVTSRV